MSGLLELKRQRMPSHGTLRRVFHTPLEEAEFDRRVQEYHQQEQTGSGKVLFMDGKALRGTRVAGQERSDPVLSLYAVDDQLVLAQAAVDTKENEIVAAPAYRMLLPHPLKYNNLVIGLIKRTGHNHAARARRFYAGHIAQAFGVLLTAKCPS